MKFRIFSDIHNEFYTDRRGYSDFKIPAHDDDHESTLILAGDIGLLGSPRTYTSFIKTVCDQFKYVFWIEGNHEFYHGNITKHSISNHIKESGLTNLFTNLLEIENEKIAIVGNTLWTNFDKGDPNSMLEAKLHMNDYRLIRITSDYSKLRPEDTYAIHMNYKKSIFDSVNQYKSKGWKVMVVTHHWPSFCGVSESYRGDSMNPAYCSDLEQEIIESKPDYWVCGHIHKHQEHQIGNTLVVSNPLGYPDEYGVGTDVNFSIII